VLPGRSRARHLLRLPDLVDLVVLVDVEVLVDNRLVKEALRPIDCRLEETIDRILMRAGVLLPSTSSSDRPDKKNECRPCPRQEIKIG
jgi:hypothetical protein